MPDRSRYFQGGNWLKAGDVPPKGATYTVETFDEIATPRDEKRPLTAVLRFVDIDGPFSLNATNFDKMCEKFGEDEKRWKGKKVKLVHVRAPNPKQNGKMVDALRIE